MKLPRVPSSEDLLDRAFKRSLKVVSSQPSRLDRAREEELGRVNALSDTVSTALMKVQRSFPSMERLHPFYRAMVDIELGVDRVRTDLSRLQWAAGKVTGLANDARRNIKRAESPKEMTTARKAFSGRLGSVMERMKNPLKRLERVRLMLKDLPFLSPLEVTVVVAGVPNVGKSQLVQALSTADPEVAVYPFTTKGVTVGHMEYDGGKAQVMDIPGLLDRPTNERNDIELKGIAALKEAADLVVFVFDPSLTCGYPMEAQRNLRKEMEHITDAPFIDVSNKLDLQSPLEETIGISAKDGSGVEALRQTIIEECIRLARRRKGYYEPIS